VKKPRPHKIPNEIRTYKARGKEELDEVVAGHFKRMAGPMGRRRVVKKQRGVCFVMERMNASHWWMEISFPNGENIHVNLWTKRGAKIHARAERNL
jgi:hypothetical protein